MAIDKTFTVTVVSTGSGNKYAIDGVQQDTIMIGAGLTYKFDQSNGTNSNHPLRFSTNDNNSPSAPYTTGVTASGIPGNSGAYTQIEVAADAPSTLYYYCTNHSGMGGQANTDGWGRSMWGQADWGDTNIVEQGWGRLGWGEDMWGDVPLVLLPALSATTAVGELTTEVKPGWGTLNWGENAWGDVEGTEFTIAGLSLTASLGTVVAQDVVGLTGLSATTTLNSLQSVSTDATITLPNLGLISSEGLLVPGDHSVGLSGFSITSSVGSLAPDDAIGLSGLSLTSSVGSIGISSDPVISLNGLGQTATTTLGTLTASPNSEVILSGLSLTSALNSLTTVQQTNASLVGLGQSASVTLNPVGISFPGVYKRLVPTVSTGYTRLTPS